MLKVPQFLLNILKTGSTALRSSSSMDKAKIFVSRSDFPKSGIDILTSKYDVEIWPADEGSISREALLEKVKGKDGIYVSLNEKVNDEVLDAAGPNLKVVSTMSVGVDHIDLKAAKQRGIRVGYTPGVLTEAVAELAIGLLLATSRRFFESHRHILNGTWGQWSPSWMCGPSVTGKTVGIVGFGRIGTSIAKKLLAFSVCKIYYSDSRGKPKPEGDKIGAERVPLEKLLKESDYVIVACAMTPETKNLFTEDKFKMMKKTAVFVNIARGGIVDQEALICALQDGTILAAGLDVVTPEPLPPDHILLKLDNCVVIPHLGSGTNEAREAMSALTANNIVAALDDSEMPAEYL